MRSPAVPLKRKAWVSAPLFSVPETAALELIASRHMFGLDFVIFRPHNVYGELQNIGDRYRNVLGIFMNQIMEGLPLPIFGDGEQTRAFTYVGDITPVIAQSAQPGSPSQSNAIGPSPSPRSARLRSPFSCRSWPKMTATTGIGST